MPKYTDCIEPDYGYVNHDGYVRVMKKHKGENKW